MQNWSLYSGIYTGIKVLNHWTFWIIIGLVFFSHFQAGHGEFEGLTSAFFIFFGAGGGALNIRKQNAKIKDGKPDFTVANKQLQGIFTFQELIKAAYEKGTEIPVSEIMITDFQALEPDKELSTIMDTLWKNCQNTVAPVVAGGKVLGVVSKDHIKEYLQMQVWENY